MQINHYTRQYIFVNCTSQTNGYDLDVDIIFDYVLNKSVSIKEPLYYSAWNFTRSLEKSFRGQENHIRKKACYKKPSIDNFRDGERILWLSK